MNITINKPDDTSVDVKLDADGNVTVNVTRTSTVKADIVRDINNPTSDIAKAIKRSIAMSTMPKGFSNPNRR